MIRRTDDIFTLGTQNSCYMFRVMETGQLEHLCYSPFAPSEDDEAIRQDAEALREKREFPAGNMIAYDQEHPAVTLADLRLEISSRGKGDTREPFVEAVLPDGSRTSDFVFESAEITDHAPAMETLPQAKPGEGGTEHLTVTMRDKNSGLTLELHYDVYADCDVICRRSRLINAGDRPVKILRLMSTQLDLEEDGYTLTSFHGSWAHEMQRTDVPVTEAGIVNTTSFGVSSSESNPFVMLSAPGTCEGHGRCYGFNLIYSGNHFESARVNPFGKTRFLSGISPDGFCWELGPGEALESPEAVMTCTDEGWSGVSLGMHRFVREHIIPERFRARPRPVLFNSWEAAYFKISESALLRLARKAKDLGVELFVMDDGWFGKRDSDSVSLGDWTPDLRKLPGGLDGICSRIRALGLEFGIWVEPEMVSVDSDLYRAHPDWAMQVPGKDHSEGRNQRILDLANPEVQEYIIASMSEVFSSADISYVKWDMNRIMSDVYSPYLPPEKQGEAAHRYVCALYRVMQVLTGRFPDILFEGCASGGNRFDLGILSYFPQIWGSDDTDARERCLIQEGYSYGYPLCCVSAHVSASPNHQTLRKTPLDSRFNVAAFGSLGYECDLGDLSSDDARQIRAQIAQYKEWRDVFQNGTFYRGRTGDLHEWTVVSSDRGRAVGLVFQELAEPNTQFLQYRARGLDPERRYSVYNVPVKRDISDFGDLVNTVSPIHIRPGSILQRAAARFVSMPGELDKMTASGALIMSAGVKMSPAYSGTGFNENTRYFQDFCSRMYFMEAVD